MARTKPARIRYALFDFDGVIADTEPLYVELDRRVLRHFGYEPTDTELESFIGLSSEVESRKLLAANGIEVSHDEYRAVWDSDAQIYGDPGLKPNPGLADLWLALRSAGAKIAVVSSSPTSGLVRALNRFGLLSCVDAIVGAEMVSKRKPDPEPYLRALEYLALGDAGAARGAVAFDDSGAGVASAVAAGAWTVCYRGAAAAQAAADESLEDFVTFSW
ncbi:HAD-IA family hydrolase [Paratractidigestivibacter sp.]|uniref:HAD family hydrolase n=1 Tax=Paratractidigestivibacter sp. TaxID=2847316 RepID=UPI002ABD6F93|nr:HAD-IA family hydrolase [Paratractidigestivibacter sp.]